MCGGYWQEKGFDDSGGHYIVDILIAKKNVAMYKKASAGIILMFRNFKLFCCPVNTPLNPLLIV